MYLYVSVSTYVSLLPKQRNRWRAILWPDVASQTCMKNVPTFYDIPPNSHIGCWAHLAAEAAAPRVWPWKSLDSCYSSFEAAQVSSSSTFKDARQHLGQNKMISTDKMSWQQSQFQEIPKIFDIKPFNTFNKKNWVVNLWGRGSAMRCQENGSTHEKKRPTLCPRKTWHDMTARKVNMAGQLGGSTCDTKQSTSVKLRQIASNCHMLGAQTPESSTYLAPLCAPFFYPSHFPVFPPFDATLCSA